MQAVQQPEAAGTIAVKTMRTQKLRAGFPFMINSKELPEGQCWLEYPAGNIQLVSISPGDRDFTLIRELTKKEADFIRRKYNLH